MAMWPDDFGTPASIWTSATWTAGAQKPARQDVHLWDQRHPDETLCGIATDSGGIWTGRDGGCSACIAINLLRRQTHSWLQPLRALRTRQRILGIRRSARAQQLATSLATRVANDAEADA